jgi:dTDP-4-dehydrorhamnose reductase
MNQVLILGAQGQVGRALAARAERLNIPIKALGRGLCDITDRITVGRLVKAARFVVNCAGYTAVDRAESDIDATHRVNVLGGENVAAACAAARVPLLHFSTDYTFGGEGDSPAREDASPRPLNMYGKTKLDGETVVKERHEAHIILRTSWIFSAYGQNFVKTMLRLADKQSELRVVNDQVGCPIAADDIAKAILDIIAISTESGFTRWGTYHFAGTPPVSWYEFARAIVAGSGVVVLPIATQDYPTPSEIGARLQPDLAGVRHRAV